MSWIAWASGGFGSIAHQFLYRTGASGTVFGARDATVTQLHYLRDVDGPIVGVLVLGPVWAATHDSDAQRSHDDGLTVA